MLGVHDQPVQPLARLLPGAMNEAALWIARGGDAQGAEQALDSLLAGLRQAPGTPG
ncbi:hypothetical protein [Streptomyces sp. C]|uniref:hypothetical protein n=1 Tax=Streptomyces sp. C TaxID=253839 RepID=UPI0001B54138|nr:hypothetical protein [Streptomyces sp. C]